MKSTRITTSVSRISISLKDLLNEFYLNSDILIMTPSDDEYDDDEYDEEEDDDEVCFLIVGVLKDYAVTYIVTVNIIVDNERLGTYSIAVYGNTIFEIKSEQLTITEKIGHWILQPEDTNHLVSMSKRIQREVMHTLKTLEKLGADEGTITQIEDESVIPRSLTLYEEDVEVFLKVINYQISRLS